MPINELLTKRLRLRQWHERDFASFAQLNGDREVMAYFPDTLKPAQSDAMARKCQALIAQRGWGFWAVEESASQVFIGFVGLHTPKPTLPCSPCVEIGWRLHKRFWGKGLATEAATAALEYGFETLELERIVSFTTVTNLRSRAVMERLGLADTQANFAHPDVPQGHPLQEHVLYEIHRNQWRNLRK